MSLLKSCVSASILLSCSIIVCVAGSSSDYWQASVPNGYLLGLNVMDGVDKLEVKTYNVSLFKIYFNGTSVKLWNNSYSTLNLLADDLLAVDIENELVYLGMLDQYLAVDMKTGEIKIKIPLENPDWQYFWSYDYIAKDEAVYGVCAKTTPSDWCRIKQYENGSVHVEALYSLPYTNASSTSIQNLYYLDQEEKTMWYYPFINEGHSEFAVGIDQTNAKVVFVSSIDKDEVGCIVRDHVLNRVFTIVIWNSTAYIPIALGEIFPNNQPIKILMELPAKLWQLTLSWDGTCMYDASTHTMIVLMNNMTDSLNNHSMPTHLLFVNITSLAYKLVPLPTFREKWDSKYPVKAVKFIPHSP